MKKEVLTKAKEKIVGRIKREPALLKQAAENIAKRHKTEVLQMMLTAAAATLFWQTENVLVFVPAALLRTYRVYEASIAKNFPDRNLHTIGLFGYIIFLTIAIGEGYSSYVGFLVLSDFTIESLNTGFEEAEKELLEEFNQK